MTAKNDVCGIISDEVPVATTVWQELTWQGGQWGDVTDNKGEYDREEPTELSPILFLKICCSMLITPLVKDSVSFTKQYYTLICMTADSNDDKYDN